MNPGLVAYTDPSVAKIVDANFLTPEATFTRASSAYAFVGTTLTAFATNVPRFAAEKIDGLNPGLIIEGSRTNSLRNSTMVGVVAGTPGTDPTSWTYSAGSDTALTKTIVGTGTVNGMTYMDVRVSGTPNATSSFNFALEGTTQIVSSPNQNWTFTAFLALTAGAIANFSNIRLCQVVADGSGGALGTIRSSDISGSLTSNLQRFAFTTNSNNVSVARVWPTFQLDYTSGSAVDITFRIAASQMETGTFESSFIPTTNAATTRAADSAIISNVYTRSWFNPTAGTFLASWSRGVNNSTTTFVVSIDDGTFANRIDILQTGQTNAAADTVLAGSQNSAINVGINSAVVNKAAFAFRLNDEAFCANAGTVGTDTVCDVGINLNRLLIGDGFSAAYLFGTIFFLSYFNTRIPNASLQTMTT